MLNLIVCYMYEYSLILRSSFKIRKAINRPGSRDQGLFIALHVYFITVAFLLRLHQCAKEASGNAEIDKERQNII